MSTQKIRLVQLKRPQDAQHWYETSQLKVLWERNGTGIILLKQGLTNENEWYYDDEEMIIFVPNAFIVEDLPEEKYPEHFI
jgi:hypothetical protein